MSFEDNLEASLQTRQSDKSFIDKLLASKENEEIKELIQKPKLKRSELLKLLYMLVGPEAKLLYYDEWERYVILKYFIWIREFVKCAELLYDYKDDIELKSQTCITCSGKKPGSDRNIPECKCNTFVPVLELSRRSKRLFDNCERHIEHDSKFLIDLYFNITRTTLSKNGMAFMEILKNKFEHSYIGLNQTATNINQKGAKT